MQGERNNQGLPTIIVNQVKTKWGQPQFPQHIPAHSQQETQSKQKDLKHIKKSNCNIFLTRRKNQAVYKKTGDNKPGTLVLGSDHAGSTQKSREKRVTHTRVKARKWKTCRMLCLGTPVPWGRDCGIAAGNSQPCRDFPALHSRTMARWLLLPRLLCLIKARLFPVWPKDSHSPPSPAYHGPVTSESHTGPRHMDIPESQSFCAFPMSFGCKGG